MENANKVSRAPGAIGYSDELLAGGEPWHYALRALTGGALELRTLHAAIGSLAAQIVRDDQPRDALDLRTLYAVQALIDRRLAVLGETSKGMISR